MSEDPSKTAAPLLRVPLSENATGQGLLLVSLGLLCLGVVMVLSAMVNVRATDEPWYSRVDGKQVIYATMAAFVLMTFWRLDVRRLSRGRRFPWAAGFLLAVALGLCVLPFVQPFSHPIGGFKRWVRMGPVTFQPSEVLKLALVIFLAAWLTRPGVRVRSFFRTFLPALGLIAGCMYMIITQDFGTAMLIGVVAGVALLLAGVRWWYLVLLIALAGVGFYFFVYEVPHRWERVQTWLDPEKQDPRATYQINESKLAIASGGWTGKGLGMGTVKLGYLPERTTDFIFAVICEELGLVGGVMVIAMFALWVLLARRAAARAPDRFGCVLAGSLGFMIGLQAALHMAVDLVVAPPKGLGLPFVSAGGTSLMIMAVAAAMIVSVTAKRAVPEPVSKDGP